MQYAIVRNHQVGAGLGESLVLPILVTLALLVVLGKLPQSQSKNLGRLKVVFNKSSNFLLKKSQNLLCSGAPTDFIKFQHQFHTE